MADAKDERLELLDRAHQLENDLYAALERAEKAEQEVRHLHAKLSHPHLTCGHNNRIIVCEVCRYKELQQVQRQLYALAHEYHSHVCSTTFEKGINYEQPCQCDLCYWHAQYTRKK